MQTSDVRYGDSNGMGGPNECKCKNGGNVRDVTGPVFMACFYGEVACKYVSKNFETLKTWKSVAANLLTSEVYVLKSAFLLMSLARFWLLSVEVMMMRSTADLA